jgi:hypothetical protein
MTFAEKREVIADVDEEILLADGFEDALAGYVRVFTRTAALYDHEKCISILVKRDGMSYEEAHEYFEFNVVGAYVGEHTPAFGTFFPAAPAKDGKRKPATKRKAAAKVSSKGARAAKRAKVKRGRA